MKKLIILLFFAPLLTFAQQMVTVTGHVTPANPMAPRDSIRVYVEDSINWGSPITIFTNSNGYYSYAYPLPISTGQSFVRVSIDPCIGVSHNSYTQKFWLYNFGAATTFNYDFFTCNTACDATLATDSLPNGDLIAIFSSFDYQSVKMITTATGSIVLNSFAPVDTINITSLIPPGSNWICVGYGNACTICDTLTNAPLNCQAAFIVDTVNSFNSQVIIWNTSTASPNTVYHWDFGDGSSGTGPFPTHNYIAAATYTVCLTITDTISNCTSTHCDTLGIDSLGNLIYKGTATGFVLRVLDPNSISTNDVNPSTTWEVYPNPAKDFVKVTLQGVLAADAQAQLLNFNGQVVATFNKMALSNHLLQLPDLPTGLYILHIQNGTQVHTEKLRIQH